MGEGVFILFLSQSMRLEFSSIFSSSTVYYVLTIFSSSTVYYVVTIPLVGDTGERVSRQRSGLGAFPLSWVR